MELNLLLLVVVVLVAPAITTTAADGLANLATRWSLQAANMSDLARLGVQVLQQVVEGPATNTSLKLLLDPSLPIFVQNVILKQQPLQFSSTNSLLHLAIFNSFPAFLNRMLLRPKFAPQNLLLMNLGSDYDATTLLMEPWLSGIYNLALLTPMSRDPGSLAAYTLLPFCSLSPHYLGQWNPKAFSIWESLFPDRFPNTCRASFHVASWFASPPYLYLKDPDKKPAGVNLVMMEVLAKKLNFSYTTSQRPVDGKWGALENGTWVGILGMVRRGECNFTLNSFFTSEERLEAFSATYITRQAHVVVFLKVPMPLPLWTNLVRPFSLRIWGLLVVATILVSACLALQSVCEGQEWNAELGLLRAVLAQSAPLRSHQRPRLLMYLWLLTCLILCAAFTSTLVGIFTRPAFPPRITYLSQLFASGKRLTAHDAGSFTSSSLRTTPDLTLRSLTDLYPLEEQALGLMEARSHAYVGSSIYNKIMLMKFNITEWYTLREILFTAGEAFLFRKNTPWKAMFDRTIKSVVQTGITEHWLKAELRSLGYTKKHQGDGRQDVAAGVERPITPSHLQGLFLLLGIAWVASCTTFCLELMHKSYRSPPTTLTVTHTPPP